MVALDTLPAEPVPTDEHGPERPALPRDKIKIGASNRLRRERLQLIGQLAGGVVHDINNLLTAIVLNSDALNELATDAKLGALAETTRMSAERASELTRQLLAFMRDQRIPPRLTDVNAAIGKLELLLRRTLGELIELRVFTEADPALVMVDPAQFDMALLNLAINARDAMPGGGRLTIRACNVRARATAAIQGGRDATGKCVLIEVADSGRGMPADILARVREPFFTTKPAGRGIGLGLANVQAFVAAAGGSIDIASRPKVGTTVALTLPAAAAARPSRQHRRRGLTRRL